MVQAEVGLNPVILIVSSNTYEPEFPVTVTVDSEDPLPVSIIMKMWNDIVTLYDSDTIENGLTRFYFRNQADATLFVLKWDGYNDPA